MSVGAEGSEKGGSAHAWHAAARELQGLGTRPWIHVRPLHHSRDHHAVTKSRNELTRRIQSHTASTGLTAQPRPVLPSFSPRPSLEGQGAGQGPLIPTHWPLPTARTFLLKTKGILSRFPSYQQGDPGVWCLSGAPAISLLLRRGRGPQQPHF